MKEGIEGSIISKDTLKGLVTLASLITAIGLILLFFSVNFGTALAENWLLKQGGVETSIYLTVIDGFINIFLAAGSILFGIGLVTITFFYYKILIINE